MADTPLTVVLSAPEVAEVSKAVNGQGGMQDLLRELIPRISSDGSLTISSGERERIRRYASAYGKGGFQDRFKTILRHLPPSGPESTCTTTVGQTDQGDGRWRRSQSLSLRASTVQPR